MIKFCYTKLWQQKVPAKLQTTRQPDKLQTESSSENALQLKVQARWHGGKETDAQSGTGRPRIDLQRLAPLTAE